MPLYPLRCAACSRDTDEYARMSERDGLRCSHCGGVMLTRFGDLGLRRAPQDREFARTESVLHRYAPEEAAYWRKRLRTNSIRDDGTVHFATRKEEREFVQRKQDDEARMRSDAVANWQKEREQLLTNGEQRRPTKTRRAAT